MAVPRRIQRRRAKGWRMPEGAVFVGRPSRWGNPWEQPRRGFARLVWLFDGKTDFAMAGVKFDLGAPLPADELVARHAAWLRLGTLAVPDALTAEGRAQFIADFGRRREALLAALPSLAGRDLACWCPEGAPCHADTLLALANGGRR